MKRLLFVAALGLSLIGSGVSAEALTLPTTVINFPTPTKATFGDADKEIFLTQNAGVTNLASLTPNTCSLSGARRLKILAAGTCKLVATNAGASGFKPARAVSRSFIISKALNLISVTNFVSLSVANPEEELATTELGGTTLLASLTKSVCVVQGRKVFAIKVGKCTIKASNSGNSNYLAAKTISKTYQIPATSINPPPVPFAAPWTIRLLNFDDSNSVLDSQSADSWVSSGWFKPGLSFRIAKLEVLSTIGLRYQVTDHLGRATPNKLVQLSVGKRYAGSNARVRVNNQTTSGVDVSPADQLLVTGITDANGQVTFDVTGLDTTAASGLFVQVAAWITGLEKDVIDITNLEYSLNAGWNNSDPILTNPNAPIDSLFYQACTGVTLYGQIANIDVDPVDKTGTVLAVSRGRSDAPSGIWDYSVLASLPKGSFVSTGSRLVTVDLFSPAAGINVLLRFQNGRSSYTKYIQALATTTKVNQWESLTFNFNNLSAGSQNLDLSVSYSSLALLVEPGKNSTGIKIYLKNFRIPGALIPSNSLSASSTQPVLSEKAGPSNGYLWREEFNGSAKSRPH